MEITYTKTNGNAGQIPGRNISSWMRTIRNAYKGATEDGRSRYIGSTYMTYFITTDEDSIEACQHGQLRVDADGTVWKMERKAT